MRVWIVLVFYVTCNDTSVFPVYVNKLYLRHRHFVRLRPTPGHPFYLYSLPHFNTDRYYTRDGVCAHKCTFYAGNTLLSLLLSSRRCFLLNQVRISEKDIANSERLLKYFVFMMPGLYGGMYIVIDVHFCFTCLILCGN